MESIFCDLIVKNNEVEYDFFLFPNPVSDYLTITSNTSFESVSIYDSFGKMLLKTNEKNIFLGHFSKGYYFIRIDCASGTQTKKIMIK